MVIGNIFGIIFFVILILIIIRIYNVKRVENGSNNSLGSKLNHMKRGLIDCCFKSFIK